MLHCTVYTLCTTHTVNLFWTYQKRENMFTCYRDKTEIKLYIFVLTFFWPASTAQNFITFSPSSFQVVGEGALNFTIDPFKYYLKFEILWILVISSKSTKTVRSGSLTLWVASGQRNHQCSTYKLVSYKKKTVF